MIWRASRGSWTAVLLGGSAAAVLALTALSLEAKSSYESPYGYDRTWNAALRLVRVDNGWKITEKDDGYGYILFEYKSPESTKVTSGSLELVRGREPNAPVSVLAELARMPHYHEQVLLDALASKMRREYGDAPPQKKPPASEPDAGVDGMGN
ncbi:MAG: hypothetical protein M3O46_15705 [Myxococcota bacterium]|nr:hypothetical protein [Myxococcota bacterium]